MGEARGSGFSGRKVEIKRGKFGSEWTVFVDNLSRRVPRGAIWELFNHYRKVFQVFISMVNKKLRYQDSTFAFVRFVNEEGMLRAIEKMNNIKIDGIDRQAFAKGAKNPLIGFKVDSRSFREVLMSEPKPGRSNSRMDDKMSPPLVREGLKSLCDIHIPAKEIAWIDLSLVGVLKELYDLEFIQKALLSDGINASVASWGNSPLSCIITFKSTQDRDEAWSKKEEGLSYWFEHVEPLINGNGVPAGYFFISLIGLPLHCWHESFFTALGNRWGSFVAIDKYTKSRCDFAMARMVIKAESPFDIPSSIKVRSMGRIFIIKIILGSEQVHLNSYTQSPSQNRDTLVEVGTLVVDGLELEMGGSLNNGSNPKNPCHPFLGSSFPRFGALEDVHDVAINREMSVGHADLADERLFCDIRVETQNEEIGAAQGEIDMEVGRVEDLKMVGLHFHPAMQGEGKRGKGISGALSFQNAKLIRETQCCVGNDFFNPSRRRAIRLSIRKSLEEVESPATEAKSGFDEMVIKYLGSAVGGRRKGGVLKVLKGAKGAIKEWVGSRGRASRNCVGSLEEQIHNLELIQAQGHGDSNSARQIATLR
ncbi:hypothetical protein V6N11_059511, partial [Hibiscus sabdariffa]